MVTPKPERAVAHQQLVGMNPSALIPSVRRRIPTSVDLLEPTSPLLVAMSKLSFSPHVRLHSIVGTGNSLTGTSDGVVPVASARHAGVVSEHFVPTGHSDLPQHQQTLAELIRILRSHVQEVRAGQL